MSVRQLESKDEFVALKAEVCFFIISWFCKGVYIL